MCILRTKYHQPIILSCGTDINEKTWLTANQKRTVSPKKTSRNQTGGYGQLPF